MTEEIKRYDCEGCSGYCYGGYHMADAGEYGDYVKAEDFDRVVAALEAERDALRADAERWKWAKQQGSIQDAIDSLVGDTVTIPEMEAAIDTAIAADGAQS